MSDPEIDRINEQKVKQLKPKAAAVKAEQEQRYEPEVILFQLMKIVSNYGLELQNLCRDIETQIINYKQKKLEENRK